jgi:hypothetical protein
VFRVYRVLCVRTLRTRTGSCVRCASEERGKNIAKYSNKHLKKEILYLVDRILRLLSICSNLEAGRNAFTVLQVAAKKTVIERGIQPGKWQTSKGFHEASANGLSMWM